MINFAEELVNWLKVSLHWKFIFDTKTVNRILLNSNIKYAILVYKVLGAATMSGIDPNALKSLVG